MLVLRTRIEPEDEMREDTQYNLHMFVMKIVVETIRTQGDIQKVCKEGTPPPKKKQNPFSVRGIGPRVDG